VVIEEESMKWRSSIISSVAGVSLLGGAAAAAVLGVGAPAAGPVEAPAATLLSSSIPGRSATSVAPAAPAPAPSGCDVAIDDGRWPLAVAGRPVGLEAGGPAADYLWHDDTGWHLRVTHQNDHHQVWSGVLTTTGTFSDVTGVKLEGNDSLSVGPDKHVIAFRFNNYGGIDGFDFRTHCAPGIHFDLRADGAPVNPTEVIIGHGDLNPSMVPFTIRRGS
jgi:hypothetical protein